MARADAAMRFVRALLPNGTAEPGPDGRYRVTGTRRIATLDQKAVARLITDGVLAGDSTSCRPGPGARSWLRRRLAEDEPFAAQHRRTTKTADGAALNLGESPLMRLATGGGAAFLAPHQVEAGERIRRLTERARLQPRLTMSYSPAHMAGGGAGRAPEIGDLAADARARLNACLAALPPDCAGVVFDVCGLLKGLQQVEQERGWPRRSAKLVLRIGLEEAAAHFGLSPLAIGAGHGARAWLGDGARPTRLA